MPVYDLIVSSQQVLLVISLLYSAPERNHLISSLPCILRLTPEIRKWPGNRGMSPPFLTDETVFYSAIYRTIHGNRGMSPRFLTDETVFYSAIYRTIHGNRGMSPPFLTDETVFYSAIYRTIHGN